MRNGSVAWMNAYRELGARRCGELSAEDLRKHKCAAWMVAMTTRAVDGASVSRGIARAFRAARGLLEMRIACAIHRDTRLGRSKCPHGKQQREHKQP